MDRAPEALAALSTTKRCTDCALRIDHQGMPSCERTAYVRPHDGAVTYRACSLERTLDTIGCGEKAIHFIPTEQAQAARSVRRLQLLKAIESAIATASPDPSQASEIVTALGAALKTRYGDEQLIDVLIAVTDLEEALEAADGISDGSPE